MKPIYLRMMMSNYLSEHFVPRPGYDCYFFLTDVYTFDIADTLWIFDINNLALWKVFCNRVCMCHCLVVFPYLKVETWYGYPGNCIQVPGS